MQVLQLCIVKFCSQYICVFRIQFHCSLKYVEINNLFRPNIILNIIINVSEVGDIGNSLLLSPFLVNSLCQLHESFLEFFEILVITREHEREILFPFICISVKKVLVHKVGTLLRYLDLLKIYIFHFIYLWL